VRVALDTNVLAYAEGVNGPERQVRARQVVQALADEERIIPVQALGELFTLLTRKARRSATEARAAVLAWQDACSTVDTSSAVLLDAMELARAHQLALWDSIMRAAAATAGCRTLLSEDMQDGFTWRGVTVRNPFVVGR